MGHGAAICRAVSRHRLRRPRAANRYDDLHFGGLNRIVRPSRSLDQSPISLKSTAHLNWPVGEGTKRRRLERRDNDDDTIHLANSPDEVKAYQEYIKHDLGAAKVRSIP